MAKTLTWNDLAELYQVRTSRKARTRPMWEVFEWAAKQPDIKEQPDGTLSQAD